MTRNIAVTFLESTGKTIADYDGNCDWLVADVMGWTEDEVVEAMYMEPAAWGKTLPWQEGWTWEWHMVAIVDGVVHDAWFPDLMLPPSEYIDEAFPGLEVTFNLQSHTVRPKCVHAQEIKTSL